MDGSAASEVVEEPSAVRSGHRARRDNLWTTGPTRSGRRRPRPTPPTRRRPPRWPSSVRSKHKAAQLDGLLLQHPHGRHERDEHCEEESEKRLGHRRWAGERRRHGGGRHCRPPRGDGW